MAKEFEPLGIQERGTYPSVEPLDVITPRPSLPPQIAETVREAVAENEKARKDVEARKKRKTELALNNLQGKAWFQRLSEEVRKTIFYWEKRDHTFGNGTPELTRNMGFKSRADYQTSPLHQRSGQQERGIFDPVPQVTNGK